MGCGTSLDNLNCYDDQFLDSPLPDFSTSAFSQRRNGGLPDDILNRLALKATNCTNLRQTDIPESMDKAALICLNTIDQLTQAKINGSLNDGLITITELQRLGYSTFYLIDPSSFQFLSMLRVFLSQTHRSFFLYFSGFYRIAKAADNNALERQFIFEDKAIPADVFSQFFTSYKLQSQNLIFLSEALNSTPSTPFDDPLFAADSLPQHCITILPIDKREEKGNSEASGIMTFFFWYSLQQNPSMTPFQAAQSLDDSLSHVGLSASLVMSDITGQDLPLFQSEPENK